MASSFARNDLSCLPGKWTLTSAWPPYFLLKAETIEIIDQYDDAFVYPAVEGLQRFRPYGQTKWYSRQLRRSKGTVRLGVLLNILSRRTAGTGS